MFFHCLFLSVIYCLLCVLFYFKITSVVTDNAANVTGMRAAYNVPGVHTYGCQAHVFNLRDNDLEWTKHETCHSYIVN